jgi:hypothetical protein
MLVAVAAVIAYALAARLRPRARIAIALLVFVVPCVGVTAFVFAVGDKAPPDAVTVIFH